MKIAKVREGTPCRKCGSTKRYASSGNCVACDSVRLRAAYWKNPSAHKCKKYGITPEIFDALSTAQHKKCAACGLSIASKGEAIIDHNHVTGKVRGLLCSGCNKALGFVKDSVETLLNLGIYLERHRGA